MVALTRSSSSIAADEEMRRRKTERVRELLDDSSDASIKKYAVKTGNPIRYSHDDIIKIIRSEFESGVRKDLIPIIKNNPDYVIGRPGGKLFSREHNVKYLMDHGYTKAQLAEVSDVQIAREANDRRSTVKQRDRLGRTVKSTKQLISYDLGKTKGSVDDLAKTLATKGQARIYAKTTFAHIEDVAKRDSMALGKARRWWDGEINPANNYQYKGMKDMPDGDEWKKIAQQIKDHNDQIIRNYAQAGQVAPKSELLQGHHLQPLGYGGGNSPHNIRAVLGDVLQSPESRHALLHPRDSEHLYNKVYSMLQKKGHDISAFIPDDPNLRGANARYLQSVLADVSGGGGGRNISNIAKTVGKTGLKGLTSGPLGLFGAAVSLPLLLSKSPKAQAAGEVISAATDPIGYGAFEAGHQLWKRREQRDPYMPKWQRQMKDPTWGGGLLGS